MKAVFKLNIKMRRSGNIEGIFIAEKEQIEYLLSSKIEIYFGEIAGKHSEIFGSIGADDIKMISDDKNVIKVIETYGLSTGYNPLDYTTIRCGDEFQDLSAREVINIKLKQQTDEKRNTI